MKTTIYHGVPTSAPVWKLGKTKLNWLQLNKCVHLHSYIAHYNCYLQRREPEQEKLGFMDIETSGFDTEFGFVFSYCIKEQNGKMLEYIVSKNEMDKDIYDKNLLKQFNKDVRKFDRIVTFYGSRFDVPFLRTRCIIQGIYDFPIFSEIVHTDLYPSLKPKFKLRHKTLRKYCQIFKIGAKGHPMNPKQWLKALRGNKQALKWIIIHNREDVVSTEELYNKSKLMFGYNNTSI